MTGVSDRPRGASRAAALQRERRLSLVVNHVEGMHWGTRTQLGAGQLTIDRDELAQQLLDDTRLASIDLEIAHPGESCRVLGVFDIVEPRVKLEPAGHDFPGALGPIRPVGLGSTRVLRGAAVTVLDPHARLPGHVLDLRSPPLPRPTASDLSRYAGLHHLIVRPTLRAGVAGDDAQHALRRVSLRAATLLAALTQDAPADEVEELALVPGAEHLPRVAYVYQLHSHQRPTVAGEPLLYGDNCRHLLPTILHPNEILDGAVVRSYGYSNMETYGIQNHAVIGDLYARHAHDLNFVGVVVYVANQLAEERERATLLASNLVHETLRADGAVFTKSGGGAPNVDMALIAERCEDLGVRTALILWESGAAGAGDQDATLFNSPALDAIVSIGATRLRLELGPVERVIVPAGRASEALGGPLSIAASQVCGAMDHLGSSAFMGARY